MIRRPVFLLINVWHEFDKANNQIKVQMKIRTTPTTPQLSHSHIPKNRALILATTALLTAFTVKAANIEWQGGTASYTNAADWVGGVVPGSTDTAINDNGSNNVVQINIGDPDWALNQIKAGSGAGDGAYVQNGQTLTLSAASRAFRMGIAPANTGIYTLNGGAISYGAGGFYVGEIGTGILNIYGGSITGTGNFADNFGVSATAITASPPA